MGPGAGEDSPPPIGLDGDVLVLSPAEFAETFAECIESECEPGLRGAHQKKTDPRRSLRLLRIARERRDNTSGLPLEGPDNEDGPHDGQGQQQINDHARKDRYERRVTDDGSYERKRDHDQ